MALGKLIDIDKLGEFLSELKKTFVPKGGAVSSISRSGTTFTATMADGTTFSFDQQDTTYPDATQSAHGLMSAADKTKLDSVEEGANAYSLPEMSFDTRGGAKLEENGGLVLRDESLGIGNLVQESDGYTRGGIAEITAEGHAEQFSTTGKNLLDASVLSTWVFLGDNIFSVDSDKSVTVLKTDSAAETDESQFISLPAGTYTISIENPCRLQVAANRVKIIDTGSLSTNTMTFTLSEPSDTVHFKFINSSYPYKIGHVQLELGSTATSYEPYTGGAPSPSPDYPQEIEVVRGRNLIDPSNYINAYLSAQSNGTMMVVTSSTTHKTYIAKIEPNTEYTLVCSGGDRCGISHVSSMTPPAGEANATILTHNRSTASEQSFYTYTFVTKADANYVAFYLSNNLTNYPVNYIQLERGSVAHGYVPYGDYVGMEVQGKNLLDVAPSVWENKTINVYDGVITTNNTRIMSIVEVTTNTQYTVSQNGNLETNYDLWIFAYMSNGTYVRSDSDSAYRTTFPTSFSFSTGEKAYLVFRHADNSNIATSEPFSAKFQLEVGSTATEYEPYYHTTTPIPLPDRGWVGSLPDGTADVLTLDGAGKVEWEEKTDEVVLDGSSDEDWHVAGSGSVGTHWLEFDNLIKKNDYSASMFANNLLVASYNGTVYDKPYSITGWRSDTYPTKNWFYIYLTNSTTTDNLRAFLQSNPVTVLYHLATPIIEDLGYIEDWPTEIPADATISIPELDALNVKYFVDDSISQYADQWHERTKAMDISPIEDTAEELDTKITDLTTLDPIGGLERVSDGVRIGSLVQESDGAVRGGIAGLTAEGHAEQFSTTGKNLLDVSRYLTANNVNCSTQLIDDVLIVTANASSLYIGTAGHYIGRPYNTGYGQKHPCSEGEEYTLRCSNASFEHCYIVFFNTDNNIVASPSGSNFSYFNSNECTFSIPANAAYFTVRVDINPATPGTAYETTIQLELGSTATAYEPYTGGAPSPSPEFPQTIEVVRGRNLLNYEEWKKSPILHGTAIWENNGVTLTATTDDCYTAYQIDSTSPIATRVLVSAGDVVTLSWKADSDAKGECYIFGNGDGSLRVKADNASAKSVSYTVPSGVTFVTFRLGVYSAGTTIRYSNVQISLGSTPQPYVPYGHVGMEARDPDTDELISCTALPLPSRGWVGSLPDGTADVLTLDGAGKVTWELVDDEVVLDGSVPNSTNVLIYSQGNYCGSSAVDAVIKRNTSGNTVPPIRASYLTATTPENLWDDVNITSITIGTAFDTQCLRFRIPIEENTIDAADAYLAAHPLTVLYPLDTPVIEDCGYVNLPSIEGDCTISIPELDALGVKYFVDDSAGTLARQWYDREVNESDESLAQSIAMIESTTAKSNHAVNSYFMLDNVLRKATSAIASGETITDSNSSPITVEQVITTLNNSVAALEKEVVFATTPSVSHRNIYRGKNLGTVLTTAQKAQIAAGTFDDLYVGDYWTINGRVYRIADIDYYYNSGDTVFTKHHLVVVPDASFGSGPMNDTNITTGAYKGSKMYTDSSSVLNTAKTTIGNDFGSALATHRILLTKATTNGYASSGEWTDSTVDLMNELMVYGSYIFTPAGDGSRIVYRYTVEKSQLALFRLNHRMINPGRYWYWLRDVVSAANFADVDSRGYSDSGNASNSGGVRPVFCIVGD